MVREDEGDLDLEKLRACDAEFAVTLLLEVSLAVRDIEMDSRVTAAVYVTACVADEESVGSTLFEAVGRGERVHVPLGVGGGVMVRLCE